MITFRLYRDKNKEWRWQCKARNGRIICDSAEGYKRIAGARRGMMAVVHGVRDGKYMIEREPTA